MTHRHATLVIAAAFTVAMAVPAIGRADDKGKGHDNKVVADAVVVHFGQAQPQTPDAAPVGAAVTHFLTPNDVTVKKGQAVNFVVNGGGHGIAIHAVSKNTSREDIARDLCDGQNAELADPIADRRDRASRCNGAVVTGTIVGTQNLEYQITDGKEDIVIQVPVNLPIPGSVPAQTTNPRVDDIQHSERLLATSGRAAGDTSPTGPNQAGAFLAGSTPPVAANPNATPPVVASPGNPGNRINVRFLKTGRYLVICMNRAHSLNDHMFGFVNVVDDDDDQ
jgi:hypothetical protein